MSANEVELQPDTDEVLQAEEPYGDQHVVKVEVCGPVRTQGLPTKAVTAIGKLGVGAFDVVGGPVQILRADHRRAKVTLTSPSDFYVAFSEFTASNRQNSAFVPRSTLLIIEATTDIWVAASAGTVDVFAISESWATGEGVG